jgi:GTPase SAR1 family protein
MFSLVRGLIHEIRDRNTAKSSILVAGIDGAGKTTLLESLMSFVIPDRRPRTVRPTYGLNTESITDGQTFLRFWDIGGSPDFRSIWDDYLTDATAILYVVNGDQRDRLHESRKVYDDLRIRFPRRMAIAFLNAEPSILDLFPAADQGQIFFLDLRDRAKIALLYRWLKSTATK